MEDYKCKQNQRCQVAIAVRQRACRRVILSFVVELQRMSTKHANVYHGASARLKRNPAQLTSLAPKSSTLSVAWWKVGSSVLYRRVCYAACRSKYTENQLTSSSLLYRHQARAKRSSAQLLPCLSPTSSILGSSLKLHTINLCQHDLQCNFGINCQIALQTCYYIY